MKHNLMITKNADTPAPASDSALLKQDQITVLGDAMGILERVSEFIKSLDDNQANG